MKSRQAKPSWDDVCLRNREAWFMATCPFDFLLVMRNDMHSHFIDWHWLIVFLLWGGETCRGLASSALTAGNNILIQQFGNKLNPNLILKCNSVKKQIANATISFQQVCWALQICNLSNCWKNLSCLEKRLLSLCQKVLSSTSIRDMYLNK